MKIFVTGASGFTGSHTLPLLLGKGYALKCLYRPASKRDRLNHPLVEWAPGDLNDRESLTEGMHGCQALVNIASLGFGHAGNILTAAQTAGIRRAVFVSTTAIFTNLNARSKQVRLAAEEAIQSSELVFTILRPTMIYGSPRDRNIWRLIQYIRKYPAIPVVGDGTYLQQPVFVDDVATALAAVVENDTTFNKCYNIAGKSAHPYNQIIDTVSEQLNKNCRKIHLPVRPIVSLLKLAERLRVPFPIKAEQVLRLNENKNFDYEDAQKDFQFQPRSFSEGVEIELGYLPLKE